MRRFRNAAKTGRSGANAPLLRAWILGSIVALVLAALPEQAAARYASLVMEAGTGRILHSTNADTRNYPASLTKMMTLYLVFDALQSGKWTQQTRLKVSRRAARQPASRLGLKAGSTISVRDAILALATKSANDVATVVAENLAKRERDFALKMTAKARKLGMSRTIFRNASGLPHRGQLSTARDMARLGQALMRDHPVFYRFFSERKFKYRGRTYGNHNKLLNTYAGTDGIKTGYIRASGFNLVASAERNGKRVIGVIFGANSSNHRARLMKRLLDKGFRILNRGTAMADAGKKTKAKKSANRTRTASRARRTAPSRTTSGRRGIWGVQVGAFARYSQAYAAARTAVDMAPGLLKSGRIRIVPLQKRNGRKLHRARIQGLAKHAAYSACKYLERRKRQCMELKVKTLAKASLGN